jgi:hypothetical protein
MIVPVIDMMRVFTIRLVHLRSPFSADRNHIHHRLLECGLNTVQTCCILYLVNIAFVVGAWLLRSREALPVFYVIVFGAFLLSQLPQLFMIIKKKKQIA